MITFASSEIVYVDPARALIAAGAAFLVGACVFLARRIMERLGDRRERK